MAELWAAFDGAWKVLALGAIEAQLTVEAEAGAAARRAMAALLAVEADAGAAARRASGAPLAVEADAGASTGPALIALLVVRALLADAPLYWVRRRGGRCCRNCCSCLRHGA